jgi:hypothetical protein
VAGHDVDWLIDTGASPNILSWEVYQTISASLGTLSEGSHIELRAADGNKLVVYGQTEIELQLGREVFRITVVVAGLGELQGILGMDFLSQQGCTIDVGHGKLSLGQSEYLLHRLNEDPVCSVTLGKTVVVPPESEVVVEGQLGEHFEPSASILGMVEPVESSLRNSGMLMPRALVQVQDGKVLCTLTNFGSESTSVRKGTLLATLKPVESIVNTVTAAKQAAVASQDDEVPEHLADMVNSAKQNLSPEQFAQLRALIAKKAEAFSSADGKLGRTGRVQHTIDTGNAKPIKLPARRMGIPQRKIIDEEIDKMLEQGVIEPSESPWASPVVLVKKKDNSTRFCLDYRKLNNVTKKDAYPLPNITDSLDALSGSQFFCTLDLASGYWQVEMDDRDKAKTAFVTHRGLHQFRVLPFGLTNAPATFQRLMELVLRGLQWERCLLYIDDIIIFGKTFDDTLSNLGQVLDCIQGAGLRLKPKKCHFFQKRVQFLGHLVTPDGICCDPDKISAVVDWEKPKNVKEVRSFLGFASYYRRFIYHFSELAAPLTALTQKRVPFEWTDACDSAFQQLKKKLTEAPVLAYPSHDESDRFILDTDASDTGIGAVLSQIQSDKEQVIAYASKTLSKSQRNYCTTNKELLAVVTFVKQFRHYLMGRQFTIRTDHSSLRWLTNFKQAEGMVARWIVQLSCFDYEMEHRKGTQHGNADGLSRKEAKVKRRCQRDTCPDCLKLPVRTANVVTRSHHKKQNSPEECSHSKSGADTDPLVEARGNTANAPPTRMDNPVLDPNWLETWPSSEVQKWQENDPAIGPVLASKKKGVKPDREAMLRASGETRELYAQWSHLCEINGKLYRMWKPTERPEELCQLVAPEVIRKRVFDSVHGGRLGGHLGIKRTLAGIRRRLYWPRCKRDITRWCAQCDTCASIKPGPGYRAEMGHVPYGNINDRVAIDILGELPETDNGNKYIVVISEYFTKWIVAAAIPDQTAQTVADVLMTQYISIFGAPCQIHTDQGRNFESQLFKELCKLMGTEKTRTTPYRPQSDGLVERFNRTLQQMLKAYVNDNRDDWDDHLPYVIMAYRATVHESTGCSPNLMMLGRELSMPIDLVMGPPPCPSESYRCPVEYVEWLRQALCGAHQHARQHLQQSTSRQKSHYDLRHYPKTYEPEQFVWRWYPPAAKQKLGKGWTGPYKIISCPSPHNCVIQKTPETAAIRVHIDHLKPYNGQDPACWTRTPHHELDTQAHTKNSDISDATSIPNPDPEPEIVPANQQRSKWSNRPIKVPDRLSL